MKKRIGVFGSYKMMNLVYSKGEFYPVYNYVLNKLKINNEVINFAKGNLDLIGIKDLVKNMTNVLELEEIYLSLGEVESSLSPDNILLNKENIIKVIEELFTFIKNNKITAKIELLPNDNKSITLINDIIIKLAKEYGITIINETIEIKIIGNRKYFLSSLYI